MGPRPVRPPDWPERLAAYIAASRDKRWCWGQHDCCSFARGAVLAAGGPDLGAGWAGAYADEAEAGEAIRSLGRDLEEAMERVCALHGLPEIEPPMAQRGDLVVLRDRMLIGGVPAAAICMGRDALATTIRGLLAVPMRSAVRAWGIG